MKAKLRKNIKNIHVSWPLFAMAVLFVLMLTTHLVYGSSLSSVISMFACWLPLTVITVKPYEITDNNKLNGNKTISIPLICRLERKEKGGFLVHYTQMEDGIVYYCSFYPADEQLFIDKLLEINPNIKLN